MKIKKDNDGIKTDEFTLRELARTPREATHISVLILLLTLNAGWTDLVAYLFLGKVFASFMTGNILFIGLAFAQADIGLLIRAVVALSLNFIGVMIGALIIHRLPQRQTALSWRNRIMITLLVEWVFLLTFVMVSFTTSNLTQQSSVQVILLGLAAFGMGIQGAIVIAFEFPGVVANAMTGVVLVLGQRAGRGIAHSRVEGQWRWTFLLPILYALGAITVALTAAMSLTRVFPLIISTTAIIYVFLLVGMDKIDGKSATSCEATK